MLDRTRGNPMAPRTSLKFKGQHVAFQKVIPAQAQDGWQRQTARNEGTASGDGRRGHPRGKRRERGAATEAGESGGRSVGSG